MAEYDPLKLVEYGRQVEREVKQYPASYWILSGIVIGYALTRFGDWFYWEVLL